MRNERKAQIVTILILAGTVGVAVLRKTDLHTSFTALGLAPEPTPQDAVYAMLDAARAGNAANYLTSFTGQMEESLGRAVSESADFAQYLRNSNAAIKGIVVHEPQGLPEGEVKVRVEYVFQDRNEIQILYLRKTPPSGWKISQVDSAERIETLTPYGAPIP